MASNTTIAAIQRIGCDCGGGGDARFGGSGDPPLGDFAELAGCGESFARASGSVFTFAMN
jgi:hypothetical protein